MKKFSDKKAIIFDFDMTLLDTKGDIADALAYLFTKYTGSPISPDRILPHIGKGLQAMFNELLPNIKVGSKDFLEKMYEFQGYYKEHCNIKTYAYPGVEDTLKELKNRGYALAVATNKHGNIAKHVAEKNGIVEYFAHFQGTEKMIGKPDPGVINACLKVIGLKAEQVVCVGDKHNDVIAAKAANCQSISVTYGVDSKEKLTAEEPDIIIDRFDELLKIF